MDFQKTLLSRICHDFASPLSALIMSLDAFKDSKNEDFFEHATQSAKRLTALLDMYRMMNTGDEISASHWSIVMQDALRFDGIKLSLQTEVQVLSSLNAQLLSYCVLFLRRFIHKGGVIIVQQTRSTITAIVESEKMMLPDFEINNNPSSSKMVFDAMLSSIANELNVRLTLQEEQNRYSLLIS